MSTLKIPTARVFKPLLSDTRYKAAWGGRGSGKSQFFAGEVIKLCVRKPGLRVLCCREVQKSLKESAKRLLEAKIEEFGQGHEFDVQTAEIKTPGGGLIAFAGLQDHTSESIKSYEGFDVAWIEEAQTVSERSLNLLRPTIRAPGSSLWFSWNPRFDSDAVDKMFRGDAGPPTNSVVVKANWSDNPWFPAELEQERLDCIEQQPEQYDHIWEGGYATITEGAYYAKDLAKARAEKRLTRLAADPLLPIKAYFDIGIRDATAIWIVQQVGQELRFLDYYEAENQPLAAHLNWLRDHGYDRAECVLPHDGAQRDKSSAKSYEDHILEAGFNARSVTNQGKGAYMKRIESARRLFTQMQFDDVKCAEGLKALGWYHERKNAGGYGVGAEHDWASHGADAFGLAAIDYNEPRIKQPTQHRRPVTTGGWMG